ncbi:MAG TPA: nucleotide sugar dehydrogenase [Cytophagaceae bacterium]|jgi:UDP-N-acetyl-D-galactosamine dehydrogenase
MDFSISAKVKSKDAILAVIGLGYVGLPIALTFARTIRVIGFDINAERVALMQQGIDPSGEVDSAGFEGTDIEFTNSPEVLKKATFFIIAVPTPLDIYNMPDLKPLRLASETVGSVLKAGDYVVYESTVYPGCTEEDCIPILEKKSGLKLNAEFKVGYSPERINPGDKEHTLEKLIKVVSGSDEIALQEIGMVYGIAVKAGIHSASSIKVAEAAKIIENTQRDLNIALMNELSIICDKLHINTYEVLEAAGTKWNFLKFSPGLVGGHCIGIDPYYLTYKAKQLGYNPNVILSGRYINDYMGGYIAKKTLQFLIEADKKISQCRVLVMGCTFKENVEDIRNSKVVDIIAELDNFKISVDVIDPQASIEEFSHEYGYYLKEEPSGKYDAIILAVPHKEYLSLAPNFFQEFMETHSVFIDIKGVFRNKIITHKYWSL